MTDLVERDEVLRQLDNNTNQTWLVRRKRWAAFVRAQDAEIERLTRALVDVAADAGEVLAEKEATIKTLHADLRYARDGLTKGRTRMRDDNARLRAAAQQARAALRYHRDQTRPIQSTDDALRALDEALK